VGWLLSSFSILLISSTAQAENLDEKEGASLRLETTVLVGYSIKINRTDLDLWGPHGAFRIGVTHDLYPIYLGTMVGVHFDGKDFAPRFSKVLTKHFGGEVGIELRHLPWILRLSIGFGAISQKAISWEDDDEMTVEGYFSPGITGIWFGRALLGIDLRPIIGLGKHVQSGFVFMLCHGGRFSL
jgi:hypothetical protein